MEAFASDCLFDEVAPREMADAVSATMIVTKSFT
jgi:hypothetical protein